MRVLSILTLLGVAILCCEARRVCKQVEPSKCPANEVYSKCGANCQSDCSGLRFRCANICRAGCICAPGYTRTRRGGGGKCVKKCPVPVCPANEVFSKCGFNCQSTCSTKVTACACSPGCICAPGYTRTAKGGKCVQKCPPPTVCKAGEVESQCNGHCQATCAKPNPICTRNCVKGCVCPAGQIRDAAGKCIPKAKCPGSTPVCPANEVFSRCGANCQRDCYGLPKPCANICTAGCICASGYTRNEKDGGKCVQKCPPLSVCKAGEVESQCNGHCQATCAKPNPICTRNCVKGCVCPAGQIRDAAGKCIPKAKCPGSTPVCPVNEVFSKCSADCQPSCSGKPMRCANTCTAGCICATGYTRNLRGDGKCVKKCPPLSVCPANEVYSDCNAGCQNDCSGFLKPCAKICRAGCICAPGFTRDQNNKNICVKKCPVIVTPPTPAPGTCKANEVWAPCPSGCSACRFFTNKMIACDPARKCTPGCACVAGYRKDNAGLCVKETECPGYKPDPKVCPKNEVWSQCGRNSCHGCGVNPQLCKPACGAPGCACAEGYRQNSAGQCVLPAQCPGSTPVCPANEVYSKCGANCQRDCYGLPKPCANICTAGCICASGYTRNEKDGGKCVQKCPPLSVCKAGEVESQCNGHCQATCAKPNPICTRNCVKGCVCPAGQIRDAAGKCIPKAKCPSTDPQACPKNQVWSKCGMNGCQSCGVDPTVCRPGCFAPGCTCAEGYKRNAAGSCVLPAQCPAVTPAPNECPINEYWGPCGHNSCENCLVFLNQAACRPFCQPGCQCLDGYRRNDAGVCIPESQCQAATPPPPACPANEVYSKCNAGCQNDCSGFLKPCAKICQAGCICAPGFTRDQNNKYVCVKKCPVVCVQKAACIKGASWDAKACKCVTDVVIPACKKNESLMCFNGCPEQTCTPNKARCLGPPIGPDCTKTCQCNSGYVRDNGVCVLQSKCPKVPACTGAHQVYSTCINSCMTCDVITNRRPCDPLPPPHCSAGCTCASGYRRDGSGVCIPTELCPRKLPFEEVSMMTR